MCRSGSRRSRAPPRSDTLGKTVEIQHQTGVISRYVQQVLQSTKFAKRQECHGDAAQANAGLALLKPRHGTLGHAHACREVGHGQAALLSCYLDVATEATKCALN